MFSANTVLNVSHDRMVMNHQQKQRRANVQNDDELDVISFLLVVKLVHFSSLTRSRKTDEKEKDENTEVTEVRKKKKDEKKLLSEKLGETGYMMRDFQMSSNSVDQLTLF